MRCIENILTDVLCGRRIKDNGINSPAGPQREKKKFECCDELGAIPSPEGTNGE